MAKRDRNDTARAQDVSDETVERAVGDSDVNTEASVHQAEATEHGPDADEVRRDELGRPLVQTVSGEWVPVPDPGSDPEINPDARNAEDVDATQAEKAAVPADAKDVNKGKDTKSW